MTIRELHHIIPEVSKITIHEEEVMTWFEGQAADFYDSGIQQLVPRLNKCLDSAGDYVEK